MAGGSRKAFECITSGYPLRDYQVCYVTFTLFDGRDDGVKALKLCEFKTAVELKIREISQNGFHLWTKNWTGNKILQKKINIKKFCH